jgi:hypothetical protein
MESSITERESNPGITKASNGTSMDARMQTETKTKTKTK